MTALLRLARRALTRLADATLGRADTHWANRINAWDEEGLR